MSGFRGRARPIERCRACGGAGLETVLDLGTMALTGVFPREGDADVVPRAPLELVRCSRAAGSPEACGLVQLRHSFDPAEMYGEHYGYRSSLNRAMARHLGETAAMLAERVPLRPGDLVLDIGSNDGTLLASFPEERKLTLVGIDPTAGKFREHYRADAEVLSTFFSAEAFRERFGGRKAKLVTSIAMFYDLEDPAAFMEAVRGILAPEGLWHFEQSYLPAMLRRSSYDTVCHEHLEYYALGQVAWMAERAGLEIVAVAMNDVNGGSFAVTAAPAGSGRPAADLAPILEVERALALEGPAPWEAFRQRIDERRERLLALLDAAAASGERILGYGASTKGNVILQHCGIGPERIAAIAEVNEDKFGCVTPGTRIPIVPEPEARAMRPSGFLVLPWHFREGIVRREAAFLRSGGRLVFPLPDVETVSG